MEMKLAILRRANWPNLARWAAIVGAVLLTSTAAPAAPLVQSGRLASMDRDASALVQVARRGFVARGGRAFVGPRGGIAVRRTAVAGRVVRPGWNGAGTRWAPAVRPGWHGAGTRWVRPVAPVRRWVRPAGYWWGPGAAITAGAAVGYVGAATAAAWAGAPPAPGYCWYYTDATKRTGFWDVCPS